MSDFRFEQAMDAWQRGQVQMAIDMLIELLGEDPDEAIYHAILADCLLDQKRLSGAEYEADLALSLDPNLAFSFLVRARLMLFKRKLKLALEACDDALQLDPEFIEALLMKFNLLLMQDKRDEAFEVLESAASIAPENLLVTIGFGSYYNYCGEHTKAMEYAYEAMRLDAGSEDANVLIGQTYLALGNSAEADQHARYAVSINPTSDAALRLLVNVRMRENWAIGLWWRFNNWVTTMTNTRQSLFLIMMFLLFNLSAQVLSDLGYPTAGSVVGYAWLGLVIYSWVGIPAYKRALDKALGEFSFNPRF